MCKVSLRLHIPSESCSNTKRIIITLQKCPIDFYSGLFKCRLAFIKSLFQLYIMDNGGCIVFSYLQPSALKRTSIDETCTFQSSLVSCIASFCLAYFPSLLLVFLSFILFFLPLSLHLPLHSVSVFSTAFSSHLSSSNRLFSAELWTADSCGG